MKKQKKLNLGKIKIAGINNTHSIIGGVDSIVGMNTCSNCNTNEPECATERYCDTDVANTCVTTQHTRSESNACGSEKESQVGEIC